MKALVCGAGIAGLTLAWQLEHAGWEVELVERAPAFRDGGHMIDFYGPGYEVAERMGLAPRLLEASDPRSALYNLDRHGRQTSSLHVPESFGQLLSLLRGDLARAINDEVHAPVRYSTTVEAIEQAGDIVTVRLTDGSEREVDLLVGTDGVHSRVRELTFGAEQRYLRYLGHHVAAYILRDEDLGQRVGTGYRVITVPGRSAGAYGLRDGRAAFLFLRREPDPTVPVDPAETLRQQFGDLGWVLPDVLRSVPQPPELYYDQVTQVEMGEWSKGRVVLVGDACQAVSLFAGHGASLAMAAAWVLADELRTADTDVPAALGRYQRRMEPTIADAQALGRRVVRWMAPEHQWRITARDWMMRLAELPGINTLLLRSLTPGSHNALSRSPTQLEDLTR